MESRPLPRNIFERSLSEKELEPFMQLMRPALRLEPSRLAIVLEFNECCLFCYSCLLELYPYVATAALSYSTVSAPAATDVSCVRRRNFWKVASHVMLRFVIVFTPLSIPKASFGHHLLFAGSYHSSAPSNVQHCFEFFEFFRIYVLPQDGVGCVLFM